jgi:Flp pilus assembly protein TadG
LIEFAVAALVVVSVLVTTIEFGVEMFVRQSAERAGAVAASSYSETRSISAATSAMESSSPSILAMCSQPLEVRLFNAARGTDTSDASQGYPATDTPADAAASMARVSYSCDWRRTTPFLRAMLGERTMMQTDMIVRMRD